MNYGNRGLEKIHAVFVKLDVVKCKTALLWLHGIWIKFIFNGIFNESLELEGKMSHQPQHLFGVSS